MSSALSRLPELTWRGLSAPCSGANIDFAHNQVARAYPYVDHEGHDWTGMKSFSVPTTLHFLDTMIGGRKWFSKDWPQWFTMLLDGGAGELNHPIAGRFNARIQQGSIAFQAAVESGVVVGVTFISSLESPEKRSKLTPPTVSVESAAKAADKAVGGVLKKYPDGVDPGGSLFDAINSIKGQVGSAALSVTGAVNQFQGKIAGLVSDIEALNDVELNPATSALTSLWNSAEEFKKTAEKLVGRETRTRILAVGTSMDAIATDTGNTLGEIMGLNVQYLRTPTVPKGATIKYYGGATLKSPVGG